MDSSRRRAEYAAELDLTSPSSSDDSQATPARGTRELVAAIRDRKRPAEVRTDAIDELSPTVVEKPSAVSALIGLLGDAGEDDAVRLHALAALQLSSLRTLEFRPYVADFTTALRAAATDDNKALRVRAMEILALMGDSYVQDLLMSGLRDPAQALVPPQDALRMIGYDVHADHYPLLREIVETSEKPQLRRKALKLLAADSSFKDNFSRIAADKTEDKKARSTSALALLSLAPTEFDEIAGAILDDPDDDDEVQATVLTGLSVGERAPASTTDDAIRRLETSPQKSSQVKTAAKRYLQQRPAEGT